MTDSDESAVGRTANGVLFAWTVFFALAGGALLFRWSAYGPAFSPVAVLAFAPAIACAVLLYVYRKRERRPGQLVRLGLILLVSAWGVASFAVDILSRAISKEPSEVVYWAEAW